LFFVENEVDVGYPQGVAAQGGTVEGAGDAEGRGEGSWALGEIFGFAAGVHVGEAVCGVEGADEDGMRGLLGASDDVEEGVEAIAEVDVGDAACMVHDFGTGGAFAAIGMAGAVGDAGIAFGFGDDASGEVAIDVGAEELAEEGFSDVYDVACLVEAEGKLFHDGVAIRLGFG